MKKDLIIIGGGPGGYEIAAEAARDGRQVTLFEKAELGGTCLNRGCIPTKCLCASATALLTVQEAAKYGVDVDGYKANYDRAAARMRQVVEQLRQGIEGLLKDVEVIRAEAKLQSFTPDDDDTAHVAIVADGETYTARQVLIATGSKPAVLPIPGAELAITSDDFLKLDAVPQRVSIIGGGVIGMEFASILAAFGVEVTVVEFCKEILPPFDKEVAKRLRTSLSRRGVKTIVGAGVKSIEKDGEELVLTYAGKKGDESIRCDAAIMAVGRRPVVPEGAAEAGIELTKRGFIEADDMMRATKPGVFAVGDVNGKCMLAHAASAQARVALGWEVDLNHIPSAVFTMPECAMVGLTEEQCQEQSIEYGKGKSMFASNGKALAMGEGDGFVKVLFAPETHQLIGVHVIGPHAADIIAEATACMAGEETIDDIAISIVHGHPTLSEAFSAACAAGK